MKPISRQGALVTAVITILALGLSIGAWASADVVPSNGWCDFYSQSSTLESFL